MKEIGIGLLGFGTVGAGVVEGLQKNGDLMARRTGVRPVLRKIADVDLDRDRGVKVDRALLTKDAASVVDKSRLHHKNPVSAYDGRPLAGVVRGTWLAGNPINLDDEPRGRLLARGDA